MPQNFPKLKLQFSPNFQNPIKPSHLTPKSLPIPKIPTHRTHVANPLLLSVSIERQTPLDPKPHSPNHSTSSKPEPPNPSQSQNPNCIPSPSKPKPDKEKKGAERRRIE
eukprot:TRINITY_DN8751_c0_g4_i1.p1 TRINITY_DN8751_c0_g4~~TRINITY_DN8751_c0_g4_i1.p1  ORF type:complete len:109 (-),score=12.25 TRINITY_DN8751_c0_g4_i1:674-1000(-)